MPPDLPRARRLLADRLAAVRRRAGVRVVDVAEAIGRDQAQVSRIAAGTRLPDTDLVDRWLDACRVTDPGERRDVHALLDEAHERTVAWRSAMRDGSVQHIDRDRLAAARLVCSYQPVRVPGLLQTPDYARLVLRHVGAPGTDVDRSVADRVDNQRVLDDPSRRFVFVLGERVLARDYGRPRMLEEQRERVTTRAAVDHVEVLVLPDVALVPEVPFTIYDDITGGGMPVVAIETPVPSPAVEAPSDVAAYRALFARLRHAARPL